MDRDAAPLSVVLKIRFENLGLARTSGFPVTESGRWWWWWCAHCLLRAMKGCSACLRELAPDGFSKNQLRKTPAERRCKECVNHGEPRSGEAPAARTHHGARAHMSVLSTKHCPYPCELCGVALDPNGYERDNIQFCSLDRPEHIEYKSLRWALDSDLYDCDGGLVACQSCVIPCPLTEEDIRAAAVRLIYARLLAPDSRLLAPDSEPDSDDSDSGMCGFSRSDCEELMAQGVKPWDDDAHRVMAVLNGDYYEQYY